MQKTIFLVAALLLASCTSGRSALPERTTVLPPEEATHVLQQCSRETPKPVTGAWAVPPSVVARLEQDLPKLPSLVSQTCCGKGSSVANPRLYFRQYAGVMVEGRRYVYINAFHDQPIYLRHQDKDMWRTKPVLVCDGGEGFWGVLYDPEARKFSQLSFNGSA
jgi:hypothetical protein